MAANHTLTHARDVQPRFRPEPSNHESTLACTTSTQRVNTQSNHEFKMSAKNNTTHVIGTTEPCLHQVTPSHALRHTNSMHTHTRTHMETHPDVNQTQSSGSNRWWVMPRQIGRSTTAFVSAYLGEKETRVDAHSRSKEDTGCNPLMWYTMTGYVNRIQHNKNTCVVSVGIETGDDDAASKCWASRAASG